MNKIGDYIKKFIQDACQEHIGLENLWRVNGFCPYCNKLYPTKVIVKEKKSCCEKCIDRDCEDEIERTKNWRKTGQIWSCPCHRGLSLCSKCKEFACQCSDISHSNRLSRCWRCWAFETECCLCHSKHE